MTNAKLSIAEPVSLLKRIDIVECGEPLVDFLQHCPELLLDRPRFDYRRETVVRKSVAEKLCLAARSLPKGYRLAVIEGWRAPLIQQRMYQYAWEKFKEQHPDWSDAALRRRVNQFSAPMDPKVPPPHTTGAAVDVALVGEDGTPYEMTLPYDRGDVRCFYTAAPGLSEESQRNRKILCEAMNAAGVTNYPSEFWHYSYGDQGWAYREGRDHAIYGPITPKGWTPDSRDVQEGALILYPTPEE